MTAEKNLRIINRYVKELWNEGNLDVADEIIAPAPPGGEGDEGSVEGGPESVKTLVNQIRTFMDPLHREVHHIVANETHVTLHSTITGTHSALLDLFPYPVTGEPITFSGVATFEFKDGLIVDEPWSVWPYAKLGEILAAATVRHYVEDIWNAGNTDRLDKFLGDGCVRHEPSGDFVGVDANAERITNLRSAFPDLHFNAEVIAGSDGGTTVTRRFTMTGTHKGAIAGLAPTGRKVTSTGIGISRFENGKIAEEWISRDDAGLMHQLSS